MAGIDSATVTFSITPQGDVTALQVDPAEPALLACLAKLRPRLRTVPAPERALDVRVLLRWR